MDLLELSEEIVKEFEENQMCILSDVSGYMEECEEVMLYFAAKKYIERFN